ncbi:addiction module antidote protein, HigA family, partial [Escherichia coli]|nr:addiction module antidote protein, HigA family [Escherichia coli]
MDYCCVGRNNNDSVPSEGTLLRVKTLMKMAN